MEVMAEVRALPMVAPSDLDALRPTHPLPSCFYPRCARCMVLRRALTLPGTTQARVQYHARLLRPDFA